MKKKIMEKWVRALRSGKFKQCRNSLCMVDRKTNQNSFCCLGVLTELYLRERKRQKKGPGIKGFEVNTNDDFDPESTHYPKWMVENSDGLLPLEVAKWAGFNVDARYMYWKDYSTGCFKVDEKIVSLSELNDGTEDFEDPNPHSFKQIAKIIEKNYEHI